MPLKLTALRLLVATTGFGYPGGFEIYVRPFPPRDEGSHDILQLLGDLP